MHTGHIDGATRQLGAPKNWDRQRYGVCCGLVVRDEMMAAGEAMTSAWFPTLDEMERIVRGAPIYLTIIGHDHPPVCMAVGPTPD